MTAESPAMLTSVLSLLGIPFLIVAVVVVIPMIWERKWGGVFTFGAIGFLGVILIFAAPSILSSPKDELVVSTSKETTAPIASEVPEPAPSADTMATAEPPADLTGLWLTLGIIGGVLILGILVVLLVSVAKRARHANLELKEKQEAVAAEKARALAVWAKSTDRHRELKDKVIEIETDWDLLFGYPTLVDASVPQTAAFHRALKAADAASDEPPADLNLSMDIGALPYPKLVAQADEAWDRAWSFAQRTGTKLVPQEERRKIDQIVQLLKLARDGGGSEHERSVAYERASKLISELHFVRVPEVAMRSIETERRPMVEAPLANGGDSGRFRTSTLLGSR